MSKAFLISRKTKPVCRLALMLSYAVVITSVTACMVEHTCRYREKMLNAVVICKFFEMESCLIK